VHAGDELELRLGEVRGDVGVRERRAERRRMRCVGERAVGTDPQALLLDAAAKRAERLARQRAQFG
jgi:hypothetical protein